MVSDWGAAAVGTTALWSIVAAPRAWPWEPTDETVPHEPHDIPVDGVLTPDGYADVRG